MALNEMQSWVKLFAHQRFTVLFVFSWHTHIIFQKLICFDCMLRMKFVAEIIWLGFCDFSIEGRQQKQYEHQEYYYEVNKWDIYSVINVSSSIKHTVIEKYWFELKVCSMDCRRQDILLHVRSPHTLTSRIDIHLLFIWRFFRFCCRCSDQNLCSKDHPLQQMRQIHTTCPPRIEKSTRKCMCTLNKAYEMSEWWFRYNFSTFFLSVLLLLLPNACLHAQRNYSNWFCVSKRFFSAEKKSQRH